jgi:TP901-1 family phage major tail protein
MAGQVGRTIIVRWGAGSPPPVVAGIREKSIALAGEPVDITNDDSAGWRQIIDAAQVNTVELSASGVMLNDTLRQAWFNGANVGSGSRMQPAAFEFTDAGVVTGTISGTFYLQDFSETGNHDGEHTFEATWINNGPVLYTPA